MPHSTPTRRIAIASDHAGFDLKSLLAIGLRDAGYDVVDVGPHDAARVDYPDYGYELATALADGRADTGIAICGSGIGISIAVNRHPAMRCALVSDALSARLARAHNDANVVAFGARLIGVDTARDCVDVFLATAFDGGRHAGRIAKLSTPPRAKDPA